MTRPVTDGLYGRIIRIMLLWKTVDFKNTFSRAVASGGRGGGGRSWEVVAPPVIQQSHYKALINVITGPLEIRETIEVLLC